MVPMVQQMYGEEVKENVYSDGVVSLWWLVAALVACGGALAAALAVDARLPEPFGRRAPPDRFSAALAHDHLVNLTSIGPRVSGTAPTITLLVCDLPSPVLAVCGV